MNQTAQIVKSGTWLYDGSIPHEVWIVKQNFDYHYDPGYEDTAEKLNSEGFVYQLVIAKDGSIQSVLPASESLDEAVCEAETIITQGVHWDDHRIQPLLNGRRYSLSAGT
jgi:hypothetical protein